MRTPPSTVTTFRVTGRSVYCCRSRSRTERRSHESHARHPLVRPDGARIRRRAPAHARPRRRADRREGHRLQLSGHPDRAGQVPEETAAAVQPRRGGGRPGAPRQAGADVLVNYRTEDWVARVKEVTGGGADVIYDPVGGDVFDGSSKCIAFEGRLLVIGFAGGRIPEIAANRILLKNISVVGVHWGLYQERGSPLVDRWMADLLALVERGALRPLVWKTFPLAQAAQALAAIAARESYGKVVLHP